MTDDDPLQDPVVLRALRRVGALDQTPMCPRCGRREVAGDADWCGPCAADDRRAGKRDWFARQGDYRELRRDHGPREAAARWIAHQLRRGPVPAAEILSAAAREGIPARTLQRAREKLQRPKRGEAVGRVVVERAGLPRGASQWRLTTRSERRPDSHVAMRSRDDRADNARRDGGSSGARP